MKHKGCKLEFTQQRDEEIMNAYALANQSTKRRTMIEVAERIVSTPCSRFWVSEDRAMAIIAAMAKGNLLPVNMRKSKKYMFIEIFRRVCLLRETNPHKSMRALVAGVIMQPAPCFYMTPRSAMEIVYRIRKGR
ncbi:MAG: hypothetical protein SOY69_00525 [Alloprevotella sp.]|nr:hypothetical protein [Alloprevotella sp.]